MNPLASDLNHVLDHIVLQKSFFHPPVALSLRGTKQSPRLGGDCFGKNALAMTTIERLKKEFIWMTIPAIYGMNCAARASSSPAGRASSDAGQ